MRLAPWADHGRVTGLEWFIWLLDPRGTCRGYLQSKIKGAACAIAVRRNTARPYLALVWRIKKVARKR